jgi:hypothetical protein
VDARIIRDIPLWKDSDTNRPAECVAARSRQDISADSCSQLEMSDVHLSIPRGWGAQERSFESGCPGGISDAASHPVGG